MKLTKEQLKEVVATIYDGLSQGMTEKEVAEEMGVTVQDFESLKASMFEAKTEEIRNRPYEHVYVEYLINQSANVRDLTEMINQMHSTKKFGPMVGAIRARSDILDRLIEKGQDFGVIHKKTDRKEIIAGVVVSELSDPQLKKMILGELSMLNDLRKQFGEKKFETLDMPEEVHNGPALIEMQAEEEGGATVYKKGETPAKGNKAKTSKVRKGRKKIKKPPPIMIG